MMMHSPTMINTKPLRNVSNASNVSNIRKSNIVVCKSGISGDMSNLHDKYVKELKERHEVLKNDTKNVINRICTRNKLSDTSRKESLDVIKSTLASFLSEEIEHIKDMAAIISNDMKKEREEVVIDGIVIDSEDQVVIDIDTSKTDIDDIFV